MDRKPTTDEMLRHVLRNQRLVMLALAASPQVAPFSSDLLRNRVREMETEWEWFVPPNQRI